MVVQTAPMTVPASWIALLASIAAQHAVSADRLLLGRLTPKQLVDPNERVSLALLVELVERARVLTREPGLGILLGRQTRATLWGSVGFATLSAPTVRAALDIAVRFCGVVTPAIALQLREEGGLAEIILEERADFGPARDVFVFWLLIGIWQVGRVMTGETSTSHLEVAFPEPAYYRRLRERAPATLFDQPCNRLLVPSARLDTPYLLGDPAAMHMALELCEKQRDALGLGQTIVGRVRTLIVPGERGFPSQRDVAAQLNLSSRTLARRLAEEQTTFQALLEDERRQRALMLVLSGDRSLAETAARLGYSNVANFERAFRRWAGCSPTQYRGGARGA